MLKVFIIKVNFFFIFLRRMLKQYVSSLLVQVVLLFHLKDLIKVLNEIISFAFDYTKKTRVEFSESLVYWTSRGVGKRFFTSYV